MPPVTKEHVESVVAAITVPYLEGSAGAVGASVSAELSADQARVAVRFGFPLDVRIRQEADGGEPTVHADPDSAIGLKYREIARRIAARLATGPRDRKAAFPKIVVEGPG